MAYLEEAGETTALSSAIKLAGNFSEELSKSKGKSVNTSSLNRSSIMKASKELIMSFPVLCSDTITPETAMMITKAIERNCVTTLQLLFSSAYLKGNDGREVIKAWHNNMDDDISMDDYLDLVDAMSATYGDMKSSTSNPYIVSDKSLSSFTKEAAFLNASFIT